MQTVQTWLKGKADYTSDQLLPSISSIDLERLVGFLLKKNRAWLFANQEHVLSTNQIEQLDHWHEALCNQLPIAYITGEQAFWDLTLQVNRHTLVPRPDTELLIEVAIELLKNPQSILDLGTGSGAIGLALANTFPECSVLAVDASTEAIKVARNNAQINQISNIDFIISDWFSNIEPQTFDLIACNPPYIASDDEHLHALRHEPQSALVAGQDGLSDFVVICQHAADFLNDQGALLFEHGWQQKEAVQLILKQQGFKKIKTHKDLAGHDRVTLGFK